MNIALFGGTFDPPHNGHLAVAHAARAAFALDQIHFIPARVPPHKRQRELACFSHRYAMVALASAGDPALVPSLLEASTANVPNYSIDTVRRMAAKLTPADRLYFLIGVDAFLDISGWKDSVTLLDTVDFIIVSRPGFAMEKIAAAVPSEMQAVVAGPERIQLRRTNLYLLNNVRAEVSASEIRRLAAEQKPLCGLVPAAVGDYIHKTKLYG